ncbi:MAG: hypothetical protein U1E73_03810 [Planctomycetota bacterium]
MVGSTLRADACKELTKLMAMFASAASETLGSLVNRPLVIRPRETTLLDNEALIANLPRNYVVARGAFDKDFADRSMCVMFAVQDAVAMAGLLMMTPDEVIEGRRATGTIDGEDAEAFGELGNVLFSGIGNVLREQVPNIDVRLQRHGQVKPGLDTDSLLMEGPIVACACAMQVGSYPETLVYMVTDAATAEAWNKAPLESVGAAPAAGAPAAPKPAGTGRIEDEAFEAIPAAPLRGALAVFATHPELFRQLRLSCRRVGLDLRRHGRNEIPNPAAHRNEIVLIDIPTTDERQFEWCKRIKDFAPETKVALVLHHPSRPRVTQAFLAKADAIIGFPCEEAHLSQKLAALLESPTPNETA